jgi:hypothetical protein
MEVDGQLNNELRNDSNGEDGDDNRHGEDDDEEEDNDQREEEIHAVVSALVALTING